MKLAVNQILEIKNRFTGRVYQFKKSPCRHYYVKQLVNGKGAWKRVSMAQMELLIAENTGGINTPVYTVVDCETHTDMQWQFITNELGDLKFRSISANGKWSDFESSSIAIIVNLLEVSSANKIQLSRMNNELKRGCVGSYDEFWLDVIAASNEPIKIHSDGYSACYYCKQSLTVFTYTEGDVTTILCRDEEALNLEVKCCEDFYLQFVN